MEKWKANGKDEPLAERQSDFHVALIACLFYIGLRDTTIFSLFAQYSARRPQRLSFVPTIRIFRTNGHENVERSNTGNSYANANARCTLDTAQCGY